MSESHESLTGGSRAERGNQIKPGAAAAAGAHGFASGGSKEGAPPGQQFVVPPISRSERGGETTNVAGPHTNNLSRPKGETDYLNKNMGPDRLVRSAARRKRRYRSIQIRIRIPKDCVGSLAKLKPAERARLAQLFLANSALDYEKLLEALESLKSCHARLREVVNLLGAKHYEALKQKWPSVGLLIDQIAALFDLPKGDQK